MKWLNAEKREQFDYDLVAPLPGDPAPVSQATAEAEGEAFMAVMAMTRKEAAGGTRT